MRFVAVCEKNLVSQKLLSDFETISISCAQSININIGNNKQSPSEVESTVKLLENCCSCFPKPHQLCDANSIHQIAKELARVKRLRTKVELVIAPEIRMHVCYLLF